MCHDWCGYISDIHLYDNNIVEMNISMIIVGVNKASIMSYFLI
jgi:hypothetical protein